jgi:Mrp family chromosome partitioning ATPase
MAELIRDLRSRFDVVLLDAPPLLPVTDAALLAAQSDGLIMTVRHGKTRSEQVRIALQRVESVSGECAGVVMNMAPTSGSGYGYGYEPDLARQGRRKKDTGRRLSGGTPPAGTRATDPPVAARVNGSPDRRRDTRAASASRHR